MTRALPKRPALTNEEETRCLRTAAYLAACAVNGDTADVSFVSDPDAVLAAAGRHGMSAIVAMALEKAGMRSERTASAIATALRREAVFEAAAEEVKQRLEAEGIWYVLLKGMKLKDLYPGRGMREMADCDILTDPNRMTDVRRIMEGLGFRTDHAGTGHHDSYERPPLCRFEMHRALLMNDTKNEYYADIEKRLLPSPDGGYERLFGLEDFYLFLVVHVQKHWQLGGTGLRSFLDLYVYLKRMGDRLNMDYVLAEARKLDILAFEEEARAFALDLFGGKKLDAGQEEMLSYIAGSGTYGTVKHAVENKVERMGGGRKAKFRYFMKHLFLPMESLEVSYPGVARRRWLIPFFAVYRLGKAVLTKPARVRAELKALRSLKH